MIPPSRVTLLFPALLLFPAAGPSSSISAQEAAPGAEKILESFYPDGPGEWFKGLWIPLTIQDPPGAYRLFLAPSGRARLQARNRGPQEWSVLGPKGAWKCGPGKTTPLRGAGLRRLRLLAEGLSLLALWPLKEKAALLPSSSPEEPRFLLRGGKKLRILLDKKGLPAKLFMSAPMGKTIRVLVHPGASRTTEGPPWPSKVVIQDDTGGPALEVGLGRVRPCLPPS